MKKYMKKAACAAIVMSMMLVLTACDSFYELFTEGSESSGVYYAIYDSDSTEEELADIPEVHLMAGDLRNEIRTYDLSYEVTLSFDTETDNEATLSLYYYHNKDNPDAADYCSIGIVFLGTYTMEEDRITFSIEREGGCNVAIYTVGEDYAGLEEFQQFSFAEDKGNGVWAYENATYDYEDAVITEEILTGVPETVTFTVDGSRIVNWE